MSTDRLYYKAQTLIGVGAVIVAAGCGGGAKTADTTSTAGGPSAAAANAGGGSALSTPVPGTPPAGATVAMTALGDSIFHGEAAGGTCFTCHGLDARGTVLAPPLVAPKKWLTLGGSLDDIHTRVVNGMPTPTPPYSAAMPPMGGAQLTPAQVDAVAAYVYSISHESGS